MKPSILKNYLLQIIAPLLLFAGNNAWCQCQAAGPQNGSVFSNNTSVGSYGWSNVNNAQLPDGSFATAGKFLGVLSTATSNYLVMENPGFTLSPVYPICGIKVDITRDAVGIGVGSSIKDNSVKIIKNGVITGTEHASGVSWFGFNATATYGSSTDLWGTTWLPSDINAANFGVAVSATLSSGLAGLFLTPSIDNIQVTVYYDTTLSLLNMTLDKFSVAANGNANMLSWTTATGVSGRQFIVQYSRDSHDWQSLAVIPAEEKALQYTYRDASPHNGASYYRILLQNANGSIAYSPVQSVQQQSGTTLVYPNPALSVITVSCPRPLRHLVIKDAQGRLVKICNPAYYNGSLQLPVADLKQGLYFLQADDTVTTFWKQ